MKYSYCNTNVPPTLELVKRKQISNPEHWKKLDLTISYYKTGDFVLIYSHEKIYRMTFSFTINLSSLRSKITRFQAASLI